MKQRNYTKNKENKFQSDNFTGSNTEISNIAISILKKLIAP